MAGNQTHKKVMLAVNHQLHELSVAPGESILEAGLKTGIKMPHGCKAGRCGKCLARCVAGDMSMRSDDAFTPCIPQDAIDNGAVLTCSSFPQSDNCCVVYDPHTTASMLRNNAAQTSGKNKENTGNFDLLSSILYGWLLITLIYPVLLEFIFLPLFSLVFLIENVVIRTCLGGCLVLSSFILAPVVHYVEAFLFRLPKRYDILGGIPISASLKSPMINFPGAVALWIAIELAVHFSSGVYNTPTFIDLFIFLTVIQLSNLLVMDLVFWLVHGPYGLHHPLVFKHLHSKHHRQRVATFSTGPDQSPFDLFAEVSIFLVVPIICGFALGFNSVEFVFCSLITTLMTSTWAHSPFKIAKILPQASVTQYILLISKDLSTNPHVAHHAKIECNYSVWGLWDKIFKTYHHMDENDEQIARVVHKQAMSSAGAYSLIYPQKSWTLIADIVLVLGLCAVFWAVASSFYPNWQIESSVLPITSFI